MLNLIILAMMKIVIWVTQTIIAIIKQKNKIKNTEYKLNSNQIEDIIINKGKTNIKIYFSENNFETNYTYKNKTTNKYYFHCDKRPKCPGKANFDVVKKKILYNWTM